MNRFEIHATRAASVTLSALLCGVLLSCTPNLDDLVAAAVDEALAGRPVPGGEDGAPGAPGRNCWDIDADGEDDPEEDLNGDGLFNALDCAGQSGPPGEDGADGEEGAPGSPGVACWDLNADGIAQLDTEDTNEDGVVDVLDCRGDTGPGGSSGEPGAGFPAGSILVTDSPTPPAGFAYTGLSLSEGGGWDARAALPQGLQTASAAAMNNRVYVFGGYAGGGNNGFLNTVYEFNPGNNTWSSRAPMPTPRAESAAVALDGRMYVIGGYNGVSPALANVDIYDPATDSWSVGTPLQTPRDYPAAAVLDGAIHVFGGWDGVVYSKTLEVYDADAETWSFKTPMTVARYGAGAAVLDGKLYALGGYSGASDERTVEVYDSDANTWTPRSWMHAPREGMGVVVSNGRIYVVGGFSDVGGVVRILDSVEEYDPIAELWTPSTPLRTPRANLASAATSDGLYICGGTDRFPGTTYLSRVEVFTPPTILYLHEKQ
ncbi:MAG: N-acetylneuraminate epimerase [Phycisphaerae bacterium]|nr:N-acetylneuraminate epimerase [Phycisphaerae bacterium]